MSADGHLALCESLARTTRRMRVAAERADWDTLVAGGSECVALIERLRVSSTPNLDDVSRKRKAQLLREMLADDRFIRERTQPELTRLAAMLSVSRKAADAAARYGPDAY